MLTPEMAKKIWSKLLPLASSTSVATQSSSRKLGVLRCYTFLYILQPIDSLGYLFFHQFIQICRTLHTEFALFVLQGCHQRGVIYTLHRLFNAAARVLYHVFDQLTQGIVGEIVGYLMMCGLVHTVSALVLCQCPSILLADDEQVINSLIHRLQVFHIEEFDKECQSFMLVQISERRLPGHGETLGEGLNAGREIRNLVLAHIAIGS